MIESSPDIRAARQAVAHRTADHVTCCQGTGFIQWLLAAAQLFHTAGPEQRQVAPGLKTADLCCGSRVGLERGVADLVCAMSPAPYVSVTKYALRCRRDPNCSSD